MENSKKEAVASAVNFNVTMCDDVGYLADFEYKCPHCNIISNYSCLLDFNEVFSHELGVAIKATCKRCGKITTVAFSNN